MRGHAWLKRATILLNDIYKKVTKQKDYERAQMLLETLQELSQELTEKCVESARAVDRCRAAVADAEHHLHSAKEQEAVARSKDERVKEKYHSLREHCNGLLETPGILLEKMQQLSAEQVETSRAREDAGGIVQRRQQALGDEEARLRVAQEGHRTLQKQHQEVSEQIERVARVARGLSAT